MATAAAARTGTHRHHHRLRLVCVNDVYSFAAVDGHGGWSRAATLMRRLRDEAQAQHLDCRSGSSDDDPTSTTTTPTTTTGTTVLTTVNGDVMGGSSLLQHSRGRLAIEIMNEIPVDACVLGNHEFDYGPSALRRCIDESTEFRWFGSNVMVKSDDDSLSLLDGVLDYRVECLPHGLRVGIFGLCTEATPQLSNPTDEITFLGLEDTARRVVTQLRDEEGAHVVVALTHASTDQDRALAEVVGGIDVILGGHDHEPIALEHHHTLIFKCGQNGYWVGSVDLDVDFDVMETEETTTGDDADDGGGGVVVDDSVMVYPSWHMHSTRRVEADPAVDAIVARHRAEVDAEVLLSHGDDLRGVNLDDVVATVRGGVLDTRTARVRRMETAFGNLVADAMLAYYTEGSVAVTTPATTDTTSTLALINGGFIRGDRCYGVGTELTVRDVLEEVPFPRGSCLIELRGEHLRLGLEQQLRSCPAASGSFPHLSGNARVEYDVSSPALRRIRRLMVNGRDVEEEMKYRIVVTDFLASGGDGCSAWCFGVQQAVQDRPSKKVGIIVLNYLREKGVADTLIEGRVTQCAPMK